MSQLHPLQLFFFTFGARKNIGQVALKVNFKEGGGEIR
jgi:hypothetical protein